MLAGTRPRLQMVQSEHILPRPNSQPLTTTNQSSAHTSGAILFTDTDKSTQRTNISPRPRLPNRRHNPQSRLHRRNLTRRLRSSSPVPIDNHQFPRIRRTKHQVLSMRLKSRRSGKDGRFKVSVLGRGSRESGSSTDGAVKREIRFQLKHRSNKTIQLQAMILLLTRPEYGAP
jgi:hypothetical protein